MGLLPELFSAPVYGDGTAADLHLIPAGPSGAQDESGRPMEYVTDVHGMEHREPGPGGGQFTSGGGGVATPSTPPAPAFRYPAGWQPSADTIGADRTPNPSLPDASRPELTLPEADGIKFYTRKGYKNLNWALRGGREPRFEEGELHRQLQSAFAKVKPFREPVPVVRGLAMGREEMGPFLEAMGAAARAGSVVPMPGYLSTTVGAERDAGFRTDPNAPAGHFLTDRPNYNVELRIAAVHGLDAKPYSRVPGENELLLNHNSSFRVRGVTSGGGENVVVELEQLPPEPPKPVARSRGFLGRLLGG